VLDRLSCAFIGCHPTRFKFKYKEDWSLCKKIKAALLGQIKMLYGRGVRRFFVGGTLGVDMWAGEAIANLKETADYPDIELICVIPFDGHDIRWDGPSRRRLATILAGCDKKIIASTSDRPDAHKARNYYMVDHSDYLVAVQDESEREHSPPWQAVNYARKLKREIIFINPDTAKVTTDPK
jgi:uncharacterized phage-like protein YoqJ